MSNRNGLAFGAAPELLPPITVDQCRVLLASLLSYETLFLAAVPRLRPELFNRPHEVAYRAIWATAVQLSEQHGRQILFGDREVSMRLLDTETRAAFRNRPDLYEVQFWDFAVGETGFVQWLYKECSTSNLSYDYGVWLLEVFLRERTVNDALGLLSASTGNSVISNAGTLLQGLIDKDRELKTLGVDPVKSGAPQAWLPPKVVRTPTTITWLDQFLRGGHRPGETYFVLGANGAGKTTLGLQLAFCVAAKEQFLASGDPLATTALKSLGKDTSVPYEPGHAYYFHYEMSEDDIRMKVWSAASLIDYERIVQLGQPGFQLADVSNLTGESLSNAELAAKQISGSTLPGYGERQRLEAALEVLSKNFWQIDCQSGAVGKGYIPEIAAILANERRKGRRPAIVVIDYASACVERHTSDAEEIYQLLAQFGRRAESEISVPFQTPVWVLQQLSGESNSRTASSKQNHSNARGCKSMGDAFWFAFNIGTTDPKTGCRYFTCSKARRGELGTPPILKIAGGFNRLIDVSSKYRFTRTGSVELLDSSEVAAQSEAVGSGAKQW